MLHKCKMFLIYSIYSTALQGHDDVLTKRARHVITEIERCRKAAEALKKRDFEMVCCKSNLVESLN